MCSRYFSHPFINTVVMYPSLSYFNIPNLSASAMVVVNSPGVMGKRGLVEIDGKFL